MNELTFNKADAFIGFVFGFGLYHIINIFV